MTPSKPDHLLAWKDPEFAGAAAGNPASQQEKQKYLDRIYSQRRVAQTAFKRQFFAWVREQMAVRNLNVKTMAIRMGVSRVTVSRHFNAPHRVNTWYVPLYLFGLGVRVTFNTAPVEFIEDFPEFKPGL